MKTKEAYTELAIKLAIIEAKLDRLFEIEEERKPKSQPFGHPYALSSGSLVDSGTQQIWNKEKPVDCVSTTYIPSGDLSLE